MSAKERMEERAAIEETGPLRILSDALAGIFLLAGARLIEEAKHSLFNDDVPTIISIMINLSEISMLFGFAFLCLSSLSRLLIGIRKLSSSARYLIEYSVKAPAGVFLTLLRNIGDASGIGAIVGVFVALIIDLMMILSEASYAITLILLVIALGLIGIGVYVAIVEGRRPRAITMRESFSMGAAVIVFIIIVSIPLLALVFGGLAERWFGLIHSLLELLPLGKR